MRTTIALAVMLAAAASGGVFGQGCRIDWCSINSGGGACGSASYMAGCTVGQPAAGFEAGTNLLQWVGFWAGEVPTPTVAPTLSTARMLPDGTFVSVAGKIATSASGDFSGFFYLEESDRSSGIGIALSPSAVAGLARGSVVNVIGTLGTTGSGERQIFGPMVMIRSSTTPVAPVGMAGRVLGGGDWLYTASTGAGQRGITGMVGVNNIGMLVSIWGRVTASGADPRAGIAWAYVDDGSNVRDGTGITGVYCEAKFGTTPPAVGSYVRLTGISSCEFYNGNLVNVLRVRDQVDVRTILAPLGNAVQDTVSAVGVRPRDPPKPD